MSSASGRHLPAAVATLALLLLASLAGCRPLYLPPVPQPLELDPRLEVTARPELEDGRPLTVVTPGLVPEEGWLAIQWFSPGNREVASASVWLDSPYGGGDLLLALPQDVEVTPGRWRAVLSFEGILVRQLDFEVPAQP